MLADILARRYHGNRPVVLVGYSFGARMIFMALEHLANQKVCAAGYLSTLMVNEGGRYVRKGAHLPHTENTPGVSGWPSECKWGQRQTIQLSKMYAEDCPLT